MGDPLPAFRRASFYLALLQVGFGRRRVTAGRPGALTARFHPCLCLTTNRQAIGGTVSVPLSVAPQPYATKRLGVTQHPAHGARTFLPGRQSGLRDHPAPGPARLPQYTHPPVYARPRYDTSGIASRRSTNSATCPSWPAAASSVSQPS